MFNITNSKSEITVEHVLTLPKTSVLPAGELVCTADIDPDLDLKSSEGRDIVAKFDTLFNKKIAAGMKKQHDRIDKTRTRLEKMLHDGDSSVKIRQYADTQQEDIIRDWNNFARNDMKRVALNALEDTIKALGKKTTVVYKSLKVGYASSDTKDSQHEFLTGIIDRPEEGGGAGRNNESSMIGLRDDFASISDGFPAISAAWDSNLKLLKQAVSDAGALKSSVASLAKAAQSMEARLERIAKIEAATEAKIGVLTGLVDKSGAQLAGAQKTAVLNDAEKVAEMSRNAHSAFVQSHRRAKTVAFSPEDTGALKQELVELQKHLSKLDTLLSQKSDALLSAARTANAAHNDAKTAAKLVGAAVKEMKQQSKID